MAFLTKIPENIISTMNYESLDKAYPKSSWRLNGDQKYLTKLEKRLKTEPSAKEQVCQFLFVIFFMLIVMAMGSG